MKLVLVAVLSLTLSSCAAGIRKEPTFNETMLEQQRSRIAAGEDIYAQPADVMSSEVTQSSLWAKAVGSPYIIRNQKAQKVGDLLTVLIIENATANSEANTETTRKSTMEMKADLLLGKQALEQKGNIDGNSDYTSKFTGEGKTDRSGQLQATVQAVVEEVLPNGTLFVRGRKVITVNNEDSEVELTGFVRSDDIRIDNTVMSDKLADARIRYIGNGVIADKQRVGWGTRLIDFIWPF